MNINYENLNEITVKTQEELDMIPLGFKGRIHVKFGTYMRPAVVAKRYVRSVMVRGPFHVVVGGGNSVWAYGNSHIEAWGNSHVEACGSGSVTAYENSSIVAWGNSNVTAYGNSQIVDKLTGGRIEISENARIVHMPKTITEYCDFYGLEHDKKTGKFYKFVH
jgi:hypothetical protein